MRLVAGVARAVVRVGFVVAAFGLALVVVGLYVGSWPLRRAAGRSPVSTRLIAAQALLEALAGFVAAMRTPS